MTTKEILHRLVDELPERSLPAAERVLEDLRGGNSDLLERRLRTAPVDDEEETEMERIAVQEGREQAQRGELLTDAAVWQQLAHDDRR